MIEKRLLKYRWWFIIVPIVATLISSILLSKLNINSDLESYFPESMESKINAKIIETSFGKSEPLLLVFESDDILQAETLDRLKNISKAFNRSSIFDEVISIFDMKNITGDNGMMLVEPIIKRISKSEAKKETLRNEIRNNELAYKTIISDDFRYTLFLLQVSQGITDKDAINEVKEVLNEYPGAEKHYLSGLPFLREESNHKISRDLMILLPLGLLLMIILLFVSFKEFRGVWLPFAVVIISTVISMALLPIMGWDMSLIGVIIPIMMIAIANDYGVHFIARYQELNATKPSWNMDQIVTNTLQNLKKPIVLAGITTIVGVAGLLTHLMLPARQMGIISALGIGIALLLSLTFIPTVLSMMKKGKINSEYSITKRGLISKLLTFIAHIITSKPKRTIILFAALMLIISTGIYYVEIASDNNKVLPEQHQYNQTIQIANQHFGGDKFLSILFEGDCKDPKLLKQLNYYEEELNKIPGIGSVNSLAKVLRIMSKALNDPNSEAYNKIPESKEAVAQYLELYFMSGEPDDFENISNFDFTKTLMTIQFQAENMKELNQIIAKVDSLTSNDTNKSVMAGSCLSDKEMAEAITTGQIKSLLFAIIAILLLLIIIFRSLSAGLIGIVPLLFATVCTFGIMGITGIKLNLVTALLSSISIGVGVDYTIHLFWRLKSEIQEGKSYADAIFITLTTTGRGIVINAFSVIVGFSVLFFSAFPYLKMFATLIILSIFLCLICALILIPAICMVVKPSFLSTPLKPKNHE